MCTCEPGHISKQSSENLRNLILKNKKPHSDESANILWIL